jgi:APA family basic amino acid/polyamine antiporter
LPLIFIILLGATNFNVANLPEFNPTNLHPISLLATVTTLVMWSFIGIETATVPADNIINPQETIPKVLIASVLTILIFYIFVSIAIASIVPANELLDSSAPFALAATKILGVTGGTIISIGALISTLGSLNANTLTAGNLSLAAARDGLLPRKFVVLTKAGTPIFTYLLAGFFVSILLILNYTKGIVNAFIFMAMLSTLSTLIAYAFCAIAEFKFAHADQRNQTRKNALLLSCGTFLYAFFAIWGAGIEMIIYSLILIIIGIPIYLLKK